MYFEYSELNARHVGEIELNKTVEIGKHIGLVNIFFFTVFNPFISPFPIGTDVQLPCFILAFILTLFAVLNKKLKLDLVDVSFLIVSGWSLFYLGLEGQFDPRHRFGLPLAFLVYITIKTYWKYLNPKIVFTSIMFNALGIIFHMLSPSNFVLIAEKITRKIKVTEFSERGASGFCPEPGLASALFAILFLTLFYLRRRNDIKKVPFIMSSLVCILCMLLTKSGTGVLLLLVIFTSIFVMGSSVRIKILLVVFLISCHFVFLQNELYESSRALNLISIVIQNPSTFLQIDSSLAERAAGVSFGLVSLLEWPGGYGGGAYATIAPDLDKQYGIMSFFSTARDQTQETVSAFGKYLLEMGLIFVLLLLAIFFRNFSFNHIGLGSSALAIFFILASFSITFPGTWFLFILARNCKSSQRNRKE